MFRRFNPVLSILTVTLLLSSVPFQQTVSAQAQQQSVVAFQSLDGRTVTTESLRGRVVVLAFGATWLPLTKAQLQGVQKLADEHKGKVEVFWVSTDSAMPKSRNYASDEQLKQFAQKNNVRLTVLRDPEGAMSKRLGVDQIPSIVLLDRSGAVSGQPVLGYDPKTDLSVTLGNRIDKLQ